MIYPRKFDNPGRNPRLEEIYVVDDDNGEREKIGR